MNLCTEVSSHRTFEDCDRPFSSTCVLAFGGRSKERSAKHFNAHHFKFLTTTANLQPRTHARQRPPPPAERPAPINSPAHVQFEVPARSLIGAAAKGCCFLLSPYSGNNTAMRQNPAALAPHLPKRSRSMHDESLLCVFMVLGCRHTPDVSCASQDSSRLSITAVPNMTASTLPALRLVCLSPTPQGKNFTQK